MRLYLVRHGRAAAGWEQRDPGLDEVGRGQALEMAVAVTGEIADPRPVFSSPQRRCRETAAALAAAWGVDVQVEPRVAEMPSPAGVSIEDRVAWIRNAADRTWSELGPRYVAYRQDVVDCLLALPVSAVVVSHFFAINAVIGAATGDERTKVRSLDNCSVTVVAVEHGTLTLVEGGREADTLIR
jgi:broad specificity phosphatase PhoE